MRLDGVLGGAIFIFNFLEKIGYKLKGIFVLCGPAFMLVR